MKKIASPIRAELAQYRELASFAQFGSDLDKTTKEQLDQGERIREVLKQPQYKPLSVEHQIMIIYAVTKKYLIDVTINKIAKIEKDLYVIAYNKYPQICKAIRETKVIDE